MTRSFTTSGICTPAFELTVENGILTNINIPRRGCDGNLKGITNLITGMKAEDIIKCLDGVTCGGRGTSCPDEIDKALKTMLAEAE